MEPTNGYPRSNSVEIHGHLTTVVVGNRLGGGLERGDHNRINSLSGGKDLGSRNAERFE